MIVWGENRLGELRVPSAPAPILGRFPSIPSTFWAKCDSKSFHLHSEGFQVSNDRICTRWFCISLGSVPKGQTTTKLLLLCASFVFASVMTIVDLLLILRFYWHNYRVRSNSTIEKGPGDLRLTQVSPPKHSGHVICNRRSKTNLN